MPLSFIGARVFTALLLVSIVSPLWGSQTLRAAFDLKAPKVSMADAQARKVEIKIQGHQLLSGELDFQLERPPRVHALSSNSSMANTASVSGRTPSETAVVDVPFYVHLPRNGYFVFHATFEFDPSDTVSEDEGPVMRRGIVPIFITMKSGKIVRQATTPDQSKIRKRTRRTMPAPVSAFIGDPIDITIDIRGRVYYEIDWPQLSTASDEDAAGQPSKLKLGVPGIKVQLDWKQDQWPFLDVPPGYPADGTTTTNMDGTYHLSFSFRSRYRPNGFTNKILVEGERQNAAVRSADVLPGSYFDTRAEVPVRSGSPRIVATGRDIEVSRYEGAALRYLYRAREVAIREFKHTPSGPLTFHHLPQRDPVALYCHGSSTYEPDGNPCTPRGGEDPIGDARKDRVVWAGGLWPDAVSGYHEYGHFVEFDKVGKQLHDPVPHHFLSSTTHNVAWTEGWAHFFATVAMRHWYRQESPDRPEPLRFGEGYSTELLKLVESLQWLDVAQTQLGTGDRKSVEGAVACFLNSLWDDTELRAPAAPVHPDYEGDNDDLSLDADFMLDRVIHRWRSGNPNNALRAPTNVEAYRDALLASTLSDAEDQSVSALYNSVILGSGYPRSATATGLQITGDHSSRTLTWEDNTLTSGRVIWTDSYGRQLVDFSLTSRRANNESGFRIYRKLASQDYSWNGSTRDYPLIDTAPTNSTSHVDPTDLAAGYYSYVVTAENSSGASLARESVLFHVTAPPSDDGTDDSSDDGSDDSSDDGTDDSSDDGSDDSSDDGSDDSSTPNRPPDVEPSDTTPDNPAVDENGSPPWVVGTYEGTDPDGNDSDLDWTRGGPQDSYFKLTGSGSTRRLEFVKNPDHEHLDSYDVSLTVTDPEGASDTESFRVTVNDVNEAPTVTGPVSPSFDDRSSSLVVETYEATDPDDGDLIYWDLDGAQKSSFKPLTGTGASKELEFKSTPDRSLRDEYEAKVIARDRSSGGLTDVLTVRVSVTGNDPPAVTGPAAPEVPERTRLVGTYTGSDPNGDALIWSVTGTDKLSFLLEDADDSSQKELHFTSDPDFDIKRSYSAAVEVEDPGELSDSQSVSVTITDADDLPIFTLTPSAPRVGDTITATLTDTDAGVEIKSWVWSRISADGAAGQGISQRRDTEDVVLSDLGKQIRCKVSYDDAQGPGKSATATSAAVKAGKPTAVGDFTASRGDEEIALSWSAAGGNGSKVTAYEYKHAAAVPYSASESWTSTTSTSATVSNLTNGVQYSFTVRARNGEGVGPESTTTGVPAGLPGAPPNLTTDRPEIGSVSISWGAAADNGSLIKRYQYRRRAGYSGGWRGWFTVTGGGGARSRTVTGLRDLVRYYWELRAESDVGFGPVSSVTTEPKGLGGSSGEPTSELDNIGDNEGEPDTPMEDEEEEEATGKLLASRFPDARVVQIAPNPFNSTLEIAFLVEEEGPVKFTIHNIAGQVVAAIEDTPRLMAGYHVRHWHGDDSSGRPTASGVYFYRLMVSGEVHLGKLALVR